MSDQNAPGAAGRAEARRRYGDLVKSKAPNTPAPNPQTPPADATPDWKAELRRRYGNQAGR